MEIDEYAKRSLIPLKAEYDFLKIKFSRIKDIIELKKQKQVLHALKLEILTPGDGQVPTNEESRVLVAAEKALAQLNGSYIEIDVDENGKEITKSTKTTQKSSKNLEEKLQKLQKLYQEDGKGSPEKPANDSKSMQKSKSLTENSSKKSKQDSKSKKKEKLSEMKNDKQNKKE